MPRRLMRCQVPKFGKVSQARLDTCHPLQKELWGEVIKVFDCSILCGHRKEAEQNRLFRAGRSRVQWLDSKHNGYPSTAVDAGPYYLEVPHIRWDEDSMTRWYYFGGVVMGIAGKMGIPLRWGGDWDMDTYVRDQRFNDLPHFELIL